jgi:hypothetical protein
VVYEVQTVLLRFVVGEDVISFAVGAVAAAVFVDVVGNCAGEAAGGGVGVRVVVQVFAGIGLQIYVRWNWAAK